MRLKYHFQEHSHLKEQFAMNHNKTVINTNQPVIKARKRRDSLLYAGNYGMADTFKKVKAYVKATKGAASSEYRDLLALKFKAPKNIDPNLSFSMESPD